MRRLQGSKGQYTKCRARGMPYVRHTRRHLLKAGGPSLPPKSVAVTFDRRLVVNIVLRSITACAYMIWNQVMTRTNDYVEKAVQSDFARVLLVDEAAWLVELAAGLMLTPASCFRRDSSFMSFKLFFSSTGIHLRWFERLKTLKAGCPCLDPRRWICQTVYSLAVTATGSGLASRARCKNARIDHSMFVEVCAKK